MKNYLLPIITVFMLLFVFICGCHKVEYGIVTCKAEPRFAYQALSWKIQFAFSLNYGYGPTGNRGTVNDRVKDIKIYIYNQQTREYEVVEHNLTYVVDMAFKKELIAEAIVPERIKNMNKSQVKFYADYVFDDKRHTTKVYTYHPR